MPFDTTRHPSHLPLETLYNVRDLGGYSTQDGRITAFGRFLRADAPVRLNKADLQRLLDYPVRTVIDLRSSDEFRGQPHGLRDHPAIDYIHIPLAGDNLDEAMTAMRPFEKGRQQVDLADFYVYLLEHSQKQISRIFTRFAQAKPGATLFHCSHGKDRTGLIAALLLLLARVSDQDIIDNYQISYPLLKPWFDTFVDRVPAQFLPFLNTNPENMARTLRYFHEHYVSAEDYLAACGVLPEDIAAVRSKMLQEEPSATGDR